MASKSRWALPAMFFGSASGLEGADVSGYAAAPPSNVMNARGAESIFAVLMTLGECMGESLLLLSCGAAFLTGLGIAALSLFS